MTLETLISFGATLIVFSYLLGDNFLFRLAMYVLVGLSGAFAVIVTVESVLLPLLDGDPLNAILLVSALTLVILLLLKPIRLIAPLSSLAFAFLIAVGSAVALLGAVGGTLIPFISATANPSANGIGESLIIFIGVVTSLLYFQYLGRTRPDGSIGRNALLRLLAGLGQGFIVVTLGALYGAAILTSLSILTGQLSQFFNGG